VSAIHDENGYRDIRSKLAEQYNLGSREPNIQVWSVNVRGDRSLTLRHTMHNRRPLDEGSAQEVLKHVGRLWGFDVRLESADSDGSITQRFEVKSNLELQRL
jgi:stage V sporulation protein R